MAVATGVGVQRMFDPIQWVLAAVEDIVTASIAAGKGARDHVKPAQLEEAKPFRVVVWRSVPRPDV